MSMTFEIERQKAGEKVGCKRTLKTGNADSERIEGICVVGRRRGAEMVAMEHSEAGAGRSSRLWVAVVRRLRAALRVAEPLSIRVIVAQGHVPVRGRPVAHRWRCRLSVGSWMWLVRFHLLMRPAAASDRPFSRVGEPVRP